MKSARFRILLVADSTIDPLAHQLARRSSEIEVAVAPYDQIQNTLTGDELSDVQLAVVLSSPDKLSSEFAKALQYLPFDRKRIMDEVRDFAAVVRGAAENSGALALYDWVLPPWAAIAEMAGRKRPFDIHNILSQMNLELAGAVGAVSNVYVLKQSSVLSAAGGQSFDPKLWAIGKVLYSRVALEAFAGQILSVAEALQGRSRKLIIVDLDNTLWGGIVGDDGWQNLTLGGIDPLGEAYAIFQKQLKTLVNRGVLLGIVSKNAEETALEAIRKHPEMVLTADDFVGWRINWNDKAQNIVELVSELNLGLHSVVFIDDDPHERERVREALPEVLVPDWPTDPAMYMVALKNLTCFETAAISSEDLQRTRMYRQEKRRTEALDLAGTRETWLRALKLKVTAEPLTETHLPRAVQLLNKTNQFNLSTRRMTQQEYQLWADEIGHRVIVFHVEDKFGSYGLVGLLGLKFSEEDQVLQIIDWILSCRVMGRGVEDTMLAVAGRIAERCEFDRIKATY